ncbi:uncharacterized protein LOC113205736 [Frankliniella occidentalis]|uniref:Uncharacterized protein LOC113205736 n=1 Tax=Frankliniella occidentalis TaxID=133901 RepID=A0A6J1S889_FRAOC|nr:uncharacterized protein LOC113205736 [Frankliniella occidentalis]
MCRCYPHSIDETLLPKCYSVWEGKAFVVQPPPPSEPTTTPGRAELRRPRSAVFSIKRPPLAVPASSTDPAAEALIHHIDNVLPKGLRNLLLQLENHSDLGVMALYAVTLNRHRRLSSALRQLQQLQARTRSPEKPPKVR